MIARLHDVARRRIAATRGEPVEDGFALIFVLMVTTIVMIGVASVLVVTAGNIIPAKNSQDGEAAYAAAQAGIEDYIGYLNTNCTTFNSSRCTNITGAPVTATVKGTDNAGTETYTRTVVNPTTYLSDGFVRVTSTGKAGSGSRTLVADVSGVPNVLRFTYLSKYETLASDFLKSYFPVRSVKVPTASDAAAATNASPAISAGSKITWNAAPSSGTGSTDICDKLWYDDSSANAQDITEANPLGSELDPAYQYPGRGTLKTNYRTALPTGMDWDQTGSNATLYQPCEVTFRTGMKFTGPVYSRDAIYLNNETTGGSGPTFKIPSAESLPPVSTGWGTSTFPAANGGVDYRQFPYVLGNPSSDSSGAGSNSTVQTSVYDLQLPTDDSDAKTSSACVYTGPTRVVLNGATATITSPQTTSQLSSDTGCYPSGSLVNGIVQFSMDYTKHGGGVIYVANDGSAPATSTCGGVTIANDWQRTCQTSTSTPSSGNTVFDFTSSSGAPDAGCTGIVASPAATCAWTDVVPTQWAGGQGQLDPSGTTGWKTYSPALKCWPASRARDAADEQLFSCDYDNLMLPKPAQEYPLGPSSSPTGSDAYTRYRAAVQALLAASTVPSACGSDSPQTATTAELTCLLQSALNRANNGVACNVKLLGSTPAYSSESIYSVSAGTPVSTGSPISGDGLFTNTSGKATTFTINQQTCTFSGLLGLGLTATLGSAIPQFQVTITQGGASYFPSMKDTTQYATGGTSSTVGPGDLYVEGTGISGAVSLAAQNDAIVTGPLTTSGTSTTNDLGENAWSSGGAIALVANDNVRIFHPVSCAVAPDSDTSPGFCPNDITGLYTGGLTNADGTLKSTHPAMQYCAMTTGYTANTGNGNCSGVTATGTGAVNEIDAGVFALNGSLLTDNFNRGVSMGNTTVVGGIYQLHRGATGEQWESQNNATPATSGYTLQDTYRDLEPAGLPYVPALKTGNSTRAWNVVSISSGTNP